ncbi:MAG TPA: type IV-A pilus assembly ATPase PilB [Methylococcus sp.]|nr:type IV-A pilus assembly ATPase PilB [Methylococcus sp.]
MALNPTLQHLSGLAKSLVREGLLSEEDAGIYFEESRRRRVPFVTHLVANKVLDGAAIARVAFQEFGLPLFDLDAFALDSAPIGLVSENLIRRHHILPLRKRGNHLFVALSDPTNFQGLNEIAFQTRLMTECVLVEEEKLSRCIDLALEAADTSLKQLLDENLDNLQILPVDEETTLGTEETSEVEDAPVVRFVNKLLFDAVRKDASDIHIEPYEKFMRIRFRHDGILHEVAAPPSTLAARICARIKVMSRMDIAERRVPQDGRIKMKLSASRSIDFRVNTCPTLFGEKIVLRILDSSSSQIGIESLGFDAQQKQHFLEALAKPYGMVLVTGPTGSGKTVTLYAGLHLLNGVERNISTVEDPVEIAVAGINQVNVNSKTGLTFAEALRAFLRQDPDVIMVGEIRDLETAEIAIKAAQTGHLVLSTVHTNDAPQTLNRLMQMGVPAFNVASSVLLIMAQRLARRLCPHCRREQKVPPEVLLNAGFREEDIGQFTLFGPAGCDRCVKGYKGRIGIFQVMPISEEINRIILEGGNVIALSEQARAEGVADLRESGLRKVKAGVTSLEEIERVTRD